MGESVTNPGRYLINNSAKSGVLINAALRHKVAAFVFSSTCAVYGLPQSDRLAEDHPIAPINPYAASKASVERALDAAAWCGLRSASLRYFNATGADAAGEIGEAHEPETHLLPLAVDAALGLRDALVVHGGDYPTADGSCVRDYVHVTDLADAHLRAVQWLLRQPAGRGGHDVFNLGSGIGHSVKQVVDSVALPLGDSFRMSTARVVPAIRRFWWDVLRRRPVNWNGRRHGALKRRSRTRCGGGGRCSAS